MHMKLWDFGLNREVRSFLCLVSLSWWLEAFGWREERARSGLSSETSVDSDDFG